MDMRVPPLKIMIMLGSNPLKSRILVLSLATPDGGWGARSPPGPAGRPARREGDRRSRPAN